MNNKLSLTEIAELLTERSGKNKAASEQFLREFIAIISNSLYVDKLVKINGLGTFKIILVESRESINVNTGERFIIPEHYKYSFIPDKELKEIVNKPFSVFETTEINEHVAFEEMEEEEEDDQNPNPNDESVDEDIPEAILVEAAAEPTPVEIIEPFVESDNQPTEENSLPSKPKKTPVEIPIPSPSVPFYKREFVVAPAILIAFIAVSILIYNIYNENTTSPKRTPKVAKIEVVQQPELIPEQAIDSVELRDSVIEVVDTTPASTPTQKVIDKVIIHNGNRLTLISLKYYGNKIFWVYLYQANKKLIKNPNNVPSGIEIQIPAPELYGIDANSSVSIAKAAALQSEILSAYP